MEAWPALEPYFSEEINDPKRLKRISSISKEYDLSLAYKAASYALTRDPDATWAWQILEKVVRDPEACDLLLTSPQWHRSCSKKIQNAYSRLHAWDLTLKHFKLCATLCDSINTTAPQTKSLELGGKAWTQLKDHEAALHCWKELIESVVMI